MPQLHLSWLLRLNLLYQLNRRYFFLTGNRMNENLRMYKHVKSKQCFSWQNDDAIHPSHNITVFIYRAARSQVQGELSQIEAAWTLSMICGCQHFSLRTAHFLLEALGWRIFWGGDRRSDGSPGLGVEIMRHAWAMRLLHGQKLGRRDYQSGGWTCPTPPILAWKDADMAVVWSHLWDKENICQ